MIEIIILNIEQIRWIGVRHRWIETAKESQGGYSIAKGTIEGAVSEWRNNNEHNIYKPKAVHKATLEHLASLIRWNHMSNL